MRIAIIGGGISGLSAAWFLKDTHDITLYEKEEKLGGHAHTEVVTVEDNKIPVDTAFVVLNKRNYPNLIHFFDALDVSIDVVKMILAVSLNAGEFEWSTAVPNGLFADRRNILRPSFWKLLQEVLRFNKTARQALPILGSHQTLGSFLDQHDFGMDFRAKYLYPLTGAIWSIPGDGAEASSAKSVLQFLNNHGVLSVSGKDRLDWYTVHGGSHEYVQKVMHDLTKSGNSIRPNTLVKNVVRGKRGVEIRTANGSAKFDYVIFATHANTTLTLIDRPSRDEERLLKTFAYERNEVYLHNDVSLMPKRRRAWGTWTYSGQAEGPDGTKKTSITYYMNALQGIDVRYPLFVTLNPAIRPEPSKIYSHYVYHHPVYSSEAIRGQSELDSLQDKHRSLFCGSYFGYGFHEDGITSAISAVKHLGISPPWAS